LKDGEETIGIRMRGKVVKNKVAPPFRVAEFDMLGRCGISMSGDVLDLATTAKFVQKSGAWFNYGDVRLGQGREKARAFLEENPEMLEELKQKVLDARMELDSVLKSDDKEGGDSDD
ncbi:MAG: DNA recombination/repair protein RecA, partial [Planctomycetaceae bacterium]|nr:DNA recombination/repair protein RecA [Planctomycetaceae bacterium]